MNRDYVIICNRHAGKYPGSLLFWGHLTGDRSTRCFGGYTSDFERCERYAISELEHYPVAGKDVPFCEWRECADVAIEISRLPETGFKPVTVYMQVQS